MNGLNNVLDTVKHKLREARNSEEYDSEPGFVERWYIRSLEEIERQILYEISKKTAERGNNNNILSQ